MNTAFYGTSASGFDSRAAQAPHVVEPTMMMEFATGVNPAEDACPESQTKTVPYLSFVPPTAPTPMPEPELPSAVVRAPSSRPPFAVAFMLMAAVMMLVASGGFAVNALLELV